jgi:galactokinase
VRAGRRVPGCQTPISKYTQFIMQGMESADQARVAFAAAFGHESNGVALAPGRVNLIGEHTDYNDGFVLPMAVERGVAVGFSARTDRVVRAHATAFSETRDADITALAPRSVRGWMGYVAGVAWALDSGGVPIRGVDLAIVSDLPIGAGLSSSAAIEMAVARAICAASGAAWTPPAMARLAQRAENEFVGVACGIMDQFASAASVAGAALLLDCRSLDTRPVPIPAAATVVVMDTGVRRALASSEYNERRAACDRAVEIIRRAAPPVRALRDVDAALLERTRDAMPPAIYRRARHVVDEIRRPLAMADSLAAGDLEMAGRLMKDSHASLRDLYEVSSPELDAIVAEASAHRACYGARLTGAGFGGCAIALVATRDVEDFMGHVRRGYGKRTGREAQTFATRPAAGAHLDERSR